MKNQKNELWGVKMKRAIAKERFDRRQPFKEVGMEESKFYKVPQTDKRTGKNSDYVRISFALRLIDLLNDRFLTDTADKLDIRQSSLSDYKSGKAEPKISALAKIAGEFKVSTDYLLGMTDVKSVKPTIKSACEYTGLSDEAAKILHKNSKDKSHPLYQAILCYLIESGALDDIVYLLEQSLISGRQYSLLYEGDSSNEKDSLLATQEFQSNKKLTALYSSAMEVLNKDLDKQIEAIVSEGWKDFLDAAIETKDKMEIIIDSLTDNDFLAIQAKAIQEAIKNEVPG